MSRIFLSLLISLLVSVQAFADSGLKEKLEQIKDLSRIEALKSDHYAEKYLVRITQPLDHQHPEKGSFTQRVIVCHVGYDRPTVLVTEGYGGDYALRPSYQDELSKLLDANVVFVEHRYFLESTPSPLDWQYLTAANGAGDLHHVTMDFKSIYHGKWISSGISKGGQTTMLYRAYYPNDVDFSVPYVGPLCRGVEDGRHQPFIEHKTGTKAGRAKVKAFQMEVLKRKAKMLPLLKTFCDEKGYKFSISLPEVLDYCTLEFSFAFWQWGTPVESIPNTKNSDDRSLFDYLVKVSGPDYWALDQPNSSFYVQAARELGYYGYDTKPFRKYLTIKTAEGYLNRIMVPESARPVTFDPALYHKIYNYLKDNDPKMIFIYGANDPWSSVHAPIFKGKKNEHFFFQPNGSHRSRISNMPDNMKKQIMDLLHQWLEE
ncbi:MAG: aminopeptidase [Tannerella sp.]|jgi:hypothetical protein|nr:aminopeptidase [Tannerella sp.]